MALDFKLNDVLHKIVVKFVQAHLPNAAKPMNALPKLQTVLNTHEVASKAATYNIRTDPKVIEEGLNAGFELMTYLSADGYVIKTPLFTLRVNVPGQYDGTETSLPEGIKVQPSLIPSSVLRTYINNNVDVVFDGIDEAASFIRDVVDTYSNAENSTLTRSRVVELRGLGLKVAFDETHRAQCGVFFINEHDAQDVHQSERLVDNQPRNVQAYIPDTLVAGQNYYVEIHTQGSPRSNGHILKDVRTIRAEQAYLAQ